MMISNRTSTGNAILTNDDLRSIAPSIFASSPWERMSSKYRFAPTSEVIDILRDRGFQPVRAMQGRTRIEGKGDFTKHMIRLRHQDYMQPLQVNQEIPELVLMNSHDGTSAYNFQSGLFRIACLNGLVVASADYGGIKVRHSGADDFASRVLDATYEIIEETPVIMAKVDEWKGIPLTPPQQTAFAEAAIELRGQNVTPKALLAPRRREDAPAPDGTRDLWRTLNTAQEALIKGGVRGTATTGRRMTTRPIASVSEDIRTNRALWVLASKMAELVS